MYESGTFVAEHVRPVADEQIQPNGVDLTVETIFEQTDPGRIGVEDKTIGDREECVIETNDETEARTGRELETGTDRESDRETYTLSPGGYVARYGEVIAVPDDHVGFVYPRSSLLRNSCMLHTAVWDAGYEGRGEGLLEVHHEIEIERGARIAQFVLADAEHESLYTGGYQGEGVE